MIDLKRRMTALEAYALRSSISYGKMSPARLAAIILGCAPTDGELASVRQGLLETAPDARNGSLADVN